MASELKEDEKLDCCSSEEAQAEELEVATKPLEDATNHSQSPLLLGLDHGARSGPSPLTPTLNKCLRKRVSLTHVLPWRLALAGLSRR